MRRNQPSVFRPFAQFMIERVPGEGYQVTRAEGEGVEKAKRNALLLLDALGQPAPKGPKEAVYLVGPITSVGEYVTVTVTLTDNGEARYNQVWYQIGDSRSYRFGANVVALMMVFLVGIMTGALARHLVFAPSGAPTQNQVSGTKNPPDNPSVDFAERPLELKARVEKLHNQCKSSHSVWVKLKEYLSQEGLAADLAQSVIEQRRSVKLIADLDSAPPPQETIRLNNIEVAKLVSLFDAMEEFISDLETTQKRQVQ